MTSLLIFYGSKETYTASMAWGYFVGTLFPAGRVIVKALSSYGLAMSTDARVEEFNKFLQEAQMFGTNKTHDTFCYCKCFKSLGIIGKGGKQNISWRLYSCWWKTSVPWAFSSKYLEKKSNGSPCKLWLTLAEEAIKSHLKGQKLSQIFLKKTALKD